VTVAFIEATGLEPPTDRIAPAYQGAKLAFATAELLGELPAQVDVWVLDTGGTVAGTLEVAAEIAADRRVVAAIAAPGLPWQAALGEGLAAAGVPWVSLSSAGVGLGERGWSGWRRLVPDEVSEGEALGRLVRGLRGAREGLCALEQQGIPAGRLVVAATRTAGVPVLLETVVEDSPGSVAAAASGVAESGCGVVLWAGEGALGALLRRRLVEAGLGRIPFVGTQRIRDAGYAEAAGEAAEGTLAVCPCADVSASMRLAHQRFIQDYQAEFGLPPGPYAVEGWDAARMLIAAFRTGARERPEVRGFLAGLAAFEGLAGTYRFAPGGELRHPLGAVRTYRQEGGRWLERPGQRRG
jgi:branched-chain amino acid transport system substrate-binding protein